MASLGSLFDPVKSETIYIYIPWVVLSKMLILFKNCSHYYCLLALKNKCVCVWGGGRGRRANPEPLPLRGPCHITAMFSARHG